MADAFSNTPRVSLSSDHNANPSKFFSHFLYKAVLVTLCLVLLPLFPSLAPDFINQTLHARSWELLQLIFVGIAVSYGLFSKKNNDETDKDHHSSKIDNAQSYVSKLLQVSSVFDDESDQHHTVIEENKFQTLNSQYYRGEPAVVVVAKETPVVKQDNGVVSGITQKPLLLPVRSLKQRVPSPNEVDLADELNVKNVSRSSSKRFISNSSRNPRNGDLGRLNVQKLDEKLEENVVLRSPIPWRSRSGRMEMKEINGDDPPSFTVSSSMEEQELNRVDSRSFRSSRPNSSPKNLSPSTSFSSESQAKSSEDVVRKKIFSPPPPAPPPPPPPPPSTQQFLRKSVLMKSNSSIANNADSSEKVLRRSVRSVPESEMEELPRRVNSELRGRIQDDGLVKSVRTFRPSELVMGAEKESKDYEKKFVDKRGANEATQSYVKLPKEEKNEFIEKVLVETTDDEDSEAEAEDDNIEGSSSNREAASDDSVNDVGPDVDKKADEFIAKFREQIRLQRIESIRRSTAQRGGKSLR